MAEYSNVMSKQRLLEKEAERMKGQLVGQKIMDVLELVTLANSRSRHCFYSVVETIAGLDVTVFVRETLREQVLSQSYPY